MKKIRLPTDSEIITEYSYVPFETIASHVGFLHIDDKVICRFRDGKTYTTACDYLRENVIPQDAQILWDKAYIDVWRGDSLMMPMSNGRIIQLKYSFLNKDRSNG